MAQFILKTSNNKLIYPSEIGKDDRKKLYGECKKGLHLQQRDWRILREVKYS
jgi:hypothetical protein